MRFLADENTHGQLVRWLRDCGHDVLWATESFLGESDQVILAAALREQRVIFTADLDFGELVFHQQLNSNGVVLVRLEKLPVQERIMRLQTIWSVIEANQTGKFIVVTEGKVRVRRLQTP